MWNGYFWISTQRIAKVTGGRIRHWETPSNRNFVILAIYCEQASVMINRNRMMPRNLRKFKAKQIKRVLVFWWGLFVICTRKKKNKLPKQFRTPKPSFSSQNFKGVGYYCGVLFCHIRHKLKSLHKAVKQSITRTRAKCWTVLQIIHNMYWPSSNFYFKKADT